MQEKKRTFPGGYHGKAGGKQTDHFEMGNGRNPSRYTPGKKIGTFLSFVIG